MTRNVGPMCRWKWPALIAPSQKPCRRCMFILPIEAFKRVPHTRDGKSSWCDSCHRVVVEANRIGYHKRYRERHREAIHARDRARYKPRPLRAKPCAWCGAAFTPTQRNQQRYCSEKCRPRQHWIEGARPRVQQWTRRKVLNRDSWHCYLCNRPISKRYKWPHPLSASVDHVIPWSVSKNDHPDNLRAAHWRCNVEKGDSLLGEEVWSTAA